ncbi:hypothetical protein [Chryseobacterium sp. SIMBA_038]|uniref:hypothetical protein n=1 Tax=Chryseobacterium sp. SIMBA_038 TaxID=3085780 RepID=UPI00397E3759
MKNHRKLLLAGFAIVPLALSSWTSEEPKMNYQNTDDHSQLSSIERIGTFDTQEDNVVQSKKNAVKLNNSDITIDKAIATTRTLEPQTSFEDILKDYQ